LDLTKVDEGEVSRPLVVVSNRILSPYSRPLWRSGAVLPTRIRERKSTMSLHSSEARPGNGRGLRGAGLRHLPPLLLTRGSPQGRSKRSRRSSRRGESAQSKEGLGRPATSDPRRNETNSGPLRALSHERMRARMPSTSPHPGRTFVGAAQTGVPSLWRCRALIRFGCPEGPQRPYCSRMAPS